ncbi:MAG TPA: hypothetical protein VKA60_27645 [Blastocatellia bacterium]|nr:hypothetical protein [Blastocatellia bacterium]
MARRARGTVVVTGIQSTPVAAPPPQKILLFRRWDATALLGESGILTTGVPTNQWDAEIRRYCRRGFVNSSGVTERMAVFVEPRAIVDPRYSKSGLVLYARDALQLTVTGGPPPWGNIYGRVTYGFRAAAGNLSSANTNGTPFIGFRLDLLPNSNVADPTWKADFVNWDSTQRTSVDSGITSSQIRNMAVELNGPDQTIRWWIDGVMVRSLKPTANDVGGQNVNPAEWSIDTEVSVTAGPAPSPTFKLSSHCGVGPLLTCVYHDA